MTKKVDITGAKTIPTRSFPVGASSFMALSLALALPTSPASISALMVRIFMVSLPARAVLVGARASIGGFCGVSPDSRKAASVSSGRGAAFWRAHEYHQLGRTVRCLAVEAAQGRHRARRSREQA